MSLTATVTSPAGTVGEGYVTFTVLNGTTVIGKATMGNVAGGKASVNYKIPAEHGGRQLYHRCRLRWHGEFSAPPPTWLTS